QCTAAARRIKGSEEFIRFEESEIEQSLWERFLGQAERYPTQQAVITNKFNWTYDELRRRAVSISRALSERLDEEPSRVALLFDHDGPMIATTLGVLNSGNCYVPLDARYPAERLGFMVEDCQAGALVTDSSRVELARQLTRGSEIQVINIDELDFESGGPSFERRADPTSLAYILYTSGSAGQPKGVMQSHRNVLHHIRVYTNNLGISRGDRLTLLSSYSFDAAVMDIFGALLNGATLCVIDVMREGHSVMSEWIKRERISIYHSTPTLFRYFTRGLGEEEVLERVRLVVLGGEEVRCSDVEAFRRHFPRGSVLVNGLG